MLTFVSLRDGRVKSLRGSLGGPGALVPEPGDDLDWKDQEITTRSVSKGIITGTSLAYPSVYDRH
jgi:hypothetical protein